MKTTEYKKPQVSNNFNPKVLFQNNKYSIELCDVLHTRQPTDKKQICVVVDELFTNWVHFNSDVDLVYVDTFPILPKYIVDKCLVLARKNKTKLFEL